MFNPFNFFKYPWQSIRVSLNPFIFILWILGNIAWVWGLSERVSSLFHGGITPISKGLSVVFIALFIFVIWLLLGLQFIPNKNK